MSVPAAYLSIIMIWSTTPLAIKWSTQDAGFAFAVVSRMVVGLAVATSIIAIWRIGLPLHRRACKSYLAGGLALFGSMTLTYWGSQYIHSGLVSVLFGLSPLVTGLLALVWLKEPLTLAKLAGTLLGLVGLVVIFGDGEASIGRHAADGIMAVLMAVTFQAAGLVWVKRINDDSHPLATTAGTLVISLPLFVFVWWLSDGHIPITLSTRASIAIVYLGVFGSVLGFAFYYHVIKHMEAGKVSLITLVTPVLALLLGGLFNDESVSRQVWLGTACIGLGLGVYQWQTLSNLLVTRKKP